jgi:hypothetical protein
LKIVQCVLHRVISALIFWEMRLQLQRTAHQLTRCNYACFTDAGVDRASAYKLAEKEMAVEAEDKLKLNRKMIESARAVAGTGATPAFLADPAVYKVSSLCSEKCCNTVYGRCATGESQLGNCCDCDCDNLEADCTAGRCNRQSA